MKVFTSFIIFTFFIVSLCSSQHLTLKHRDKEKIKEISYTDNLIIITKDTIYKHHRIIDLQKNNMLLASYRDTLKVPIANLTAIKKFNFKKTGIIEPFVYIGLLSAAGTVIFPIAAAIDPEGEDPLKVLGVMAAVTVVSGGIILIVLSKRKFNLVTDWKIQTDNVLTE